jgi:23S rRNA (guanine745-N1)-methyltransferase
VRGCARPLAPVPRAFACPAGHAFDLARSGYLNLLQPQDRRSATPGDSRAVVADRMALLAAGVGMATVDAIAVRLPSFHLRAMPVIVDLGSGSGDALGRLAVRQPMNAVGIDLSTAAADLAARRFPAVTWIVANADRRLPLLAGSVDLVMSLHGRRNPAECARVLRAGGVAVIATPAATDLQELRATVQGGARFRDRIGPIVAAHAAEFAVTGTFTVAERLTLERPALQLLLRTTYRGQRHRDAARADALDRLEVTLASDVVVLSLVRDGSGARGLHGVE